MRGSVLLLLLSSARASGQAREIDRVASPGSADDFGRSCAALGDLDGDGISEFAVGAPHGGAGVEWGRVYVFSGADRSLLRFHDGKPIAWTNSEYYGWSVTSVGDLDADGVRDYVIMALASMRFEAISGASGALIREVQVSGVQGGSLSYKGIVNPGDLDGDGLDDLIVPHAFGGGGARGRVLAYSTATWNTLWGIYGENVNDNFGGIVRMLGDVDGDGASDLLIAAPRYPHFVADGAVYAFSGATQTQIWKIEGSTTNKLGRAIGVVRDVNGDGVADALVTRLAAGQIQFVEVRSGTDGSLLGSFAPSSATDSAGLDFGPPADVDGDGDLDVVVAGFDATAPFQPEQILFAWEPGQGLTLGRAELSDEGSITNAPIDALGDVDGDGFGDFVITLQSAEAVIVTFRSPPAVTTLTPTRGRHDVDTPITITGSGFALAQGLTVDLGGIPATDALVIDDATITCTVLANEPGPIAVTVTHDAGTATLADAFAHTPAVLLAGDFAPGDTFTLRVLCDVGDTLFGIFGVPPEVSLPMPPYAGALRILPLTLLFVQPAHAADEFALSFAIPSDPSLSGLEVLWQALVGPNLGGPAKSGAWTNCATLRIE